MIDKINSQKIVIKNKPSTDGTFWRGLGGHFSNLTQIISEFVDNSISGFVESPIPVANITVSIIRIANGDVKIKIIDNASGIKDLDSAFEIGSTKAKSSSLNEHGFVMKHALASANPNNDNWVITTRTIEDAQQNRYKVISAPYKFDNFEATLYDGADIESKTGTKIGFTVNKQLFKTIVAGLPGNYQTLSSIVKILKEDLGYIYSAFIKNNVASIVIEFNEEGQEQEFEKVTAIEPQVEATIDPGNNQESIDLGDGNVVLEYKFSKINENPEYKKHYTKTMSTSGVEIRINGRLLADNLFKEIWGIEKHNSYNYLLIQIDIKSKYFDRLPKTTTSKTGLRQDDEKLSVLYEWIKKKLPTPKQDSKLSDHEIDLFKQLKDAKRPHISKTDIITLEQRSYANLNEKIRIDFYLNQNNEITIYEGKKDKTTPKDVYQLMLYWDGLVYDGINPDVGVLIAAEHPKSVEAIVELVNNRLDDNKRKYNFIMKTWNQEGIPYPN